MAVLTMGVQAFDALVSRANGYRSMEKVIVTGGAVVKANTVIGRVTAAQTTVAYAGTGNGALTMDATTPLLAGAKEGIYRAIAIEPGTNVGTFQVFNPQGQLLGTHVAGGTAFANEIKFAIADGSTDFVAGDTFTIYVRAGTIAAGAGNTGNGTATFYGTGEGLVPGLYTVAITVAAANAGTFEVKDPANVVIGTGTVGTRFTNGGLDFLIADGATDFIVGDSWAITVTRGQVAAWDPDNANGASEAYGILVHTVDATSADVADSAIVRDAEINWAELNWASGVTVAQKETARAQLRARGIIERPIARVVG